MKLIKIINTFKVKGLKRALTYKKQHEESLIKRKILFGIFKKSITNS